jgi:hypothetical protein
MSNIRPKVANNECLVSMRSIVTPDNEPHCFTTLFSGAMVIRSYDFLKYGVDNEYGNVMLYQLVGVPYINQKAVEVPVEWASLSTTGLYIMLADDHIFFWIGEDYFSKYTTTKYLTSEQMLKKLNYIYEEEASELVGEEKTIHYILQGMETEQFVSILTKEGEFDIEMPNFESKLIYQNVVLPKMPRCFCIYENEIFPEFKEPLIDEKRHSVENENYVFKEILDFDQLTLLQKGVYLFNLSSDTFMWVGSRVDENDLFKLLLSNPMNIPNNINMHIVHEFYEPNIFIDLFPEWKKRTS